MTSSTTSNVLALPIHVPLSSASESEQRELEIQETASRARMLWNVDSIATASRDTLAAMKTALWHGEELGKWFTPERWLPNAGPAERTIDLAARLVHHLPKGQRSLFRPEKRNPTGRGRGRAVLPLPQKNAQTPERRLLDLAVQQLVRLLVLLRMGPAGIGKKGAGRELDPTTINKCAHTTLPQLMALGLSERLKSARGMDLKDTRFFAFVRPDSRRGTLGLGKYVDTEVKRLHVLADRGLWSDVVPDRARIDRTTPVAGEERVPTPPKSTDPHKPLPDDYVSTIGLHCQWLIRELGPAALRVAKQVEDLWIRTERAHASDAAIAQVREDELAGLLANAKWLDSKGKPITGFPFSERPLRNQKPMPRWPVVTFKQLIYIFKLIQGAQLFVSGLSFTTRHSELTTLRRDCIVPAPNGMTFANGRTWKLVDRHDGETREWVVPDLTMAAIEQQLKLVRICERIGRRSSRVTQIKEGTHLFAQIGISSADARKRMTRANGPLQWFAAAVGMEPKPGGQRLRVHRFRKTIARLAALAITQAPKVLMHVFGHKDIDSTLYYILEDKELQGEIETVARGMRVMFAHETVDAIWKSEEAANEKRFGGPAAATLSRAIEVERQSAYQRGEDFGAKNMWRLAEIVSLNGKAWQLVRPGIWCTKYPGTESGPCNKSRGRPEPSRCQSDCKHRLETPLARQDADGSIAQCVEGYRRACRKRSTHMKEFWSRQCAFHLRRFTDLNTKWSRNKSVQEMNALLQRLDKEAA